MTDLQQLFWILVALYGVECARRLRPGAACLVREPAGRPRFLTAARSALLKNDRAGIVFENVLPLGDAFVAEAWPAAISPDGVASVRVVHLRDEDATDDAPRFLAYDVAKDAAAEDAVLLVGGAPFVRFTGARAAAECAALLRRLAAAPHADREGVIDRALRARLDAAALAARLVGARRASAPAAIAASALWTYVFAGLGLVSYGVLRMNGVVAAGAYVALLATTLALSWRAHRALAPEARRERRREAWLTAISPAHASRARARLVDLAVGGCDPLAAAAACARPAFEPALRGVLLDLRRPAPPLTPFEPAVAAVAAWWRAKLDEHYVRLARAHGLDPAAVTAPPRRAQPENRTYCPRCDAQYVLESGACAPCRLPLQPLPDAAPDPVNPGRR